MKNAKNRIVLVLLFLTVIVSGCTGGNQEEDAGSSSVTVNEFSAFPNPVPSGQNTQFRMELVNDGDHDAENVYARLYNPPFGGSGSQVWKNVSGSMNKAHRTLDFPTLRAAGDQTPAVPQTRQITFKSPNLAEDRDIGYNFKSHILFNYTTVGTAEIQVMGEDTYRDQGSPQGSAGLENSNAPVQMEVRTPTPIPIYDTSGNSVVKQFCVIARNQGAGSPFHPLAVPNNTDFSMDSVHDTENELQIRIRDVGDIDFAVDSTSTTNDERPYQNITILDNRGVGCFDMNITDTSDTLQKTIPIRVDAYYGYRKQANTNVRVQGTRQ